MVHYYTSLLLSKVQMTHIIHAIDFYTVMVLTVSFYAAQLVPSSLIRLFGFCCWSFMTEWFLWGLTGTNYMSV